MLVEPGDLVTLHRRGIGRGSREYRENRLARMNQRHGVGIVLQVYEKAGATYAVVRWTKTTEEMTLDVGFLKKHGESY
jgi:hypothetical protein|tara:strand:+ start:482 stop:715 length:234 start_codon:yes stop_codon:yes gene_type:complete